MMIRIIVIILLILKVTFLRAQHDSVKTEDRDRFRKVEFIVNNERIQLNKDFKIYLFLNLDRIELPSNELDMVTLPEDLYPDSIYSAVFIYKNYELSFDNVKGVNLNYNAVWTFRLNTSAHNNNMDNSSWAFSPMDKDGWVIFAKAWYSRK